MMTQMSGISGALWGSPRRQRRFLWVSGVVLLAGIAAFLATIVFKGTGNAFPDKFSNQPAQLNHPDKPAPVSKDQIALARRFIETAVARKDLNSAYSFVHPDLRGGLSRKEWNRGAIPVLYYQADNAKTVGFKVDYSYRTQALFEVNLHAKPGTEKRPSLLFFIGLKREGGKPTGRWLVNYFEPNWRPPVPEGGGP
jgi:hypothetical protein